MTDDEHDGRDATGHGGERKQPCRRALRHALALLLLGFALVACRSMQLPASAADRDADTFLDRIWPQLPAAERVLDARDQDYAEAALTQWLQAYLHREYEVVDRRFFWTPPNSSEWVAVSKGHGSRLPKEWEAVVLRQAWHEPGSDLATVWKASVAGEERYFAVAMTDQPVPGTGGRRLVGRYELRKASED